MVFLKDVVKLVNVFLMIVLWVLNILEWLKFEILVCVQVVIVEINYVFDLLVKKICGVCVIFSIIGVLVLDIVIMFFLVEIILLIEEMVCVYGWNSFVVNMFFDDCLEVVVDLFFFYCLDGIIFIIMGLCQVLLLEKLLILFCVLVNCESFSQLVVSYILDDEQGQYDVVKVLFVVGYCCLLCLYLFVSQLVMICCCWGLECVCWEVGIELDYLSYLYMGQGDEYYYDILVVVLVYICEGKSGFDLVICGNDCIVFMVYQMLLGQGLCILQDVVVVGYDNMVGIGDLFLLLFFIV